MSEMNLSGAREALASYDADRYGNDRHGLAAALTWALDELETERRNHEREFGEMLARAEKAEAERDSVQLALDLERAHGHRNVESAIAQRDAAVAERDRLRRAIEDALAFIDDPGNWGAMDGRGKLLSRFLTEALEGAEHAD